MNGTTISYVIAGASLIIAYLSYTDRRNKDNNAITEKQNKANQAISTALTVLNTKVDMLLDIKSTVMKHEEMLIRHDEDIKNIKKRSDIQ